ncbi:MAG: tetratricopeptide repeat protein, partial [Acidobacteriota bacterium]|nr:tetratricopeptide repeat protein [Acidobacteriota bacterium]
MRIRTPAGLPLIALVVAASVCGMETGVPQQEAQAKAAVARGDSATAIRDYEALVKASPRNADYQEGLGIAYYTAGKPVDAAVPLERAVKLKPSLAESGVFPHFLGASLGESGRCAEALPYLLKNPSGIHSAALKKAVEMDGVRCSMTLDRQEDALRFLSLLTRDFSKDADALYLTTHVYSDLSTRAAQKLLMS